MSTSQPPSPYLAEVTNQAHKLKMLADRALGQVDEAAFFAQLDPESNSLAVILKHMAGNMRSRWTDFLTTDGEKPDRGRDQEFEVDGADTRAAVEARWEDGWQIFLAAVGELTEADLGRTVTIRGEPHTVLEAIGRQLSHYAYHVGQIVFLARHYAGARWQSLSIPRGKSAEYDVSKHGGVYPIPAGERPA